jgi:MipA family protein
MRFCRIFAFLAVLMGIFSAHARASEIVASGDVSNTPTIVGLGIAIMPDYIGSDDYKAVPLPIVKYTFSGSERYIKLAGPELSFNVLNHPNFQLGPLVRYYGSRDNDIDDDVVKKMKEIGSGLSAGAFLSYEIKGVDPRNRINFTFKFLTDISSQYSGYFMDLDATYWRKVAERWDVFVGAGTTYADRNYMDTYFGVNSTNRGSATISELPSFAAESGMRDLRTQAGGIWYFDANWLFGALIRYQRLLSDAADSPVVDGRGDSNQMALGVFAGYRW